MNPRSPLVVLPLVVLLIVAGVQLLDPDLDRQRPPAVDFTEPPAEVVSDSVARFGYIDYAYRIDVADERDGPWEPLRVARVNHSERRFFKSGPLAGDGVVLYGNDAVGYVRPGASGRWRAAYPPELAYPSPALSQPFAVDGIRHSSASVISENGTTMVIQVESNTMKIVRTAPGTSTFWVDKRSGVVTRGIIAYQVESGEFEYLRFLMTERNPTVARPTELSMSPVEPLFDLIRGPLGRLLAISPRANSL